MTQFPIMSVKCRTQSFQGAWLAYIPLGITQNGIPIGYYLVKDLRSVKYWLRICKLKSWSMMTVHSMLTTLHLRGLERAF